MLLAEARRVPIELECERRGIKLRGGIDRCGPCPVCGGTDRFAVNVKKQIFNCRGCRKAGDVITLVQHLDACEFSTAVETLTGNKARHQAPLPAPATTDDYERQQHGKAAWLWSQRRPITGSLAEHYLRTRGINCPLPATLGFLPARGEHPPAMIAAFGIAAEPEPGLIVPPPNINSVHLTKLKPDGSGKANIDPNKIVIGSPGALPIVLAPANDLLGLAITEGIEDGLTAHAATGLGAWAAGSAGRMPKLAQMVPSYIESITIFAHPDVSGQDGAYQFAAALDHRNNIDVRIAGGLR